MLSFADVVQSWRKADPKHIHPTREHESEVAYWESGKPQAQFVADLIPYRSTVLDFGCGDGRIAIPMAKLGLGVVACDASPEMIERLNHEAQVQDVSLKSFVADGSERLTFNIAFPFDAINARAVFIHHTHADVAMMVENLTPLLITGGYLIADWPVGKHHERRDWIDVTTWDYDLRHAVAEPAGLELVSEGDPTNNIPSVWVKR